MLGNKKTKTSSPTGTTLISKDTAIVGDIHFSGNLDIEGGVQGNILAQPDHAAFLRIVATGRIEGEIRAPAIVVNGTVVGDIHATDSLVLASQAKVQGNVYYTKLEMAEGAGINGSLQHVDGQVQEVPPVKALESVSEEPVAEEDDNFDENVPRFVTVEKVD